MTKRLEAALKYLRQLIERGYEYPDAHSKVWSHHNLHQREADELTRMYQDPNHD